MLHNGINFLSGFILGFTLLAVLLYWAPLFGCAIGYAMRSGDDFRKDRERLAELTASGRGAGFVGELTIGVLLGRLFATVVPGWNLIAWVFDLRLSPFGHFIDWLERTFTFALVRGPRKP